uniref:PHD-type domain-containing protein n=1 Tax=Strigamia maritima TaxID=126957 RepID=T1IZ57_STRMM
MKEMVGGCCVCSDERGWTENPLVYCDGHGCNVAVHQACYGIVTVPTGPWFCRKCESQERAARMRCELCPSKDGALKRTDNGGWAHVVCALYIPEVRFGNVTTMEPIILQLVPQDRFSKICYLCEEQGKESKATVGACMQCNKSGCKQHFHVTCAQAAGLLCEEAGNYMDNVKYCGYCQYHYQKLKKGNSIKTIPAFKPIPADNATPDSTPEKNTPPHELKDRGGKVRTESKKNATVNNNSNSTTNSSGNSATKNETASSLSSVVAETVSNVSFSDNSNSSSSTKGLDGPNGPGSTGKFTTANFTETVITHSGSVFGSTEKSSKKSKKTISVSSRTPKREPEADVASNAADDDFSLSTSDTGSENKTLSESGIENNVNMASSLGAMPSGTFPAYENFLSGSYPGITSTDADSSGKRPRSQSQDRNEKKKQKKLVTTNSKKSKKKKEVAGRTNGVSSFSLNVSASSLANGINSHYMSGGSQADSGNVSADTTVSLDGASSLHSQSRLDILSGSHGEGSPMNSGNRSSASPIVGPLPPSRTSSVASSRNSGLNNNLTQFPQSLEQLLERQWEQGSQFLMDQAQHFDIASLLSCLHQLRMENQRLEERVNNLITRRDHLLAVNSRLAVPLNNSPATAPAINDTNRVPRINNYIPSDNSTQDLMFPHRSPNQVPPVARASISPVNAAGFIPTSTPPHSQSVVVQNLHHPVSNMMPSMTTSSSHTSPSMLLSPNLRHSPAQSFMHCPSPVGHSAVPTTMSRPISTPDHLRMQQQVQQHHQQAALSRLNLAPICSPSIAGMQLPPPPPKSRFACQKMPLSNVRPDWMAQQPYPMYPLLQSSSYDTASTPYNSLLVSTPVSVVMSAANQHSQPQMQQQVIQHLSVKKGSPGVMATDKR